MASPALAAALKDFGAPVHPAAEPFAFDEDFSDTAAFDGQALEISTMPDLPAVEEVDVEALVAEAVASAEGALAERLAAEHAEALQGERDRHGEELAALQRQYAEEASANILAAMQDMEARLLELTTSTTARILGTVLTEDLRERSLERLAGLIREALRDNEAIRIRVRGGIPLYDALKAALPDHADQFDFTESAGIDLSVSIDDSTFETRLAEWSAALAETLT